jgi:predicted ATPase with chaperone activity
MKLFSRIIHQRLALSPQLDLPIALGMLKLEENNRLPALDAFCITGELALSGRLRAVKGVLSITLEAKRRCRQTLIVSLENAAEAAVVEGVDVYGAGSLSEVVNFCEEKSPGTGAFHQRLDRGEIWGSGRPKALLTLGLTAREAEAASSVLSQHGRFLGERA